MTSRDADHLSDELLVLCLHGERDVTGADRVCEKTDGGLFPMDVAGPTRSGSSPAAPRSGGMPRVHWRVRRGRRACPNDIITIHRAGVDSA